MVEFPLWSTATQKWVLVHDTERKVPDSPGTVPALHVEPFQIDSVPSAPTAAQNVVLAHDMSYMSSEAATTPDDHDDPL